MTRIPSGDGEHQVPGSEVAAVGEPLLDLLARGAGQRPPRVVMLSWAGMNRAGMLAGPLAARAAVAAALPARSDAPGRNGQQAVVQVPAGSLAQRNRPVRARFVVVLAAPAGPAPLVPGRGPAWRAQAAARSGRSYMADSACACPPGAFHGARRIA